MLNSLLFLKSKMAFLGIVLPFNEICVQRYIEPRSLIPSNRHLGFIHYCQLSPQSPEWCSRPIRNIVQGHLGQLREEDPKRNGTVGNCTLPYI